MQVLVQILNLRAPYFLMRESDSRPDFEKDSDLLAWLIAPIKLSINFVTTDPDVSRTCLMDKNEAEFNLEGFSNSSEHALSEELGGGNLFPLI